MSAQADLRSIARFTQSRWGLRQRNVYLKEVDQVFRSFAKNPLMGRACDEVREGYRKLPHGAHVLSYKPEGEDELLMVRILNSTTDVGSALMIGRAPHRVEGWREAYACVAVKSYYKKQHQV